MQVPSQIKGRADIWWKIKNGITKNNKIDNLTNLSYSLKKANRYFYRSYLAWSWRRLWGLRPDDWNYKVKWLKINSQHEHLLSFRATLPDVHVFNVAIGQPEIIDGINGVLMPCVDQVLVKFSKMWQNAKLGRAGTGTRLQNYMPKNTKFAIT